MTQPTMLELLLQEKVDECDALLATLEPEREFFNQLLKLAKRHCLPDDFHVET